VKNLSDASGLVAMGAMFWRAIVQSKENIFNIRSFTQASNSLNCDLTEVAILKK
jgi:hypothetical protein